MKKILFVLLAAFLSSPIFCHAQIENLIVETYYVSDSLDATDSTNYFENPAYPIPFLAAGSKTYRVYLDLAPGSRLIKIYGDINHALKISSTEDFYNNIRYPNDYFGYKVQKNKFEQYPTLALDSWLTLGISARHSLANYSGILKSDDPDGSFTEIIINSGGTAGIPDGILRNTDPLAGFPLINKDGYVPYADTASVDWSSNGFLNMVGKDSTVFGCESTGSVFISDAAYLQQNSGVAGSTPENIVLVAQFTTKGELSFELNVELEEPDGATPKRVHYVANDSILINIPQVHMERLSPYLTYPPVCGCTDPDFLEYSNRYACDYIDSCKTRIVFGCTDPLACNYDPEVNFNVQSLCCYPGLCGDRDIETVCPSLSNARLQLFPNPAKDQLTLQFGDIESGEAHYSIYNSYGQMVMEKNAGAVSGIFKQDINLAGYPSGLYMIRLFINDASYNKSFIKN